MPSQMRGAGIGLALLCALTVASCATIPRLQAADDIHAFLVSVRDGDRAGFEAHVDRDALKVQLRSRLIAETAGSGGRVATLGAALAAPLVDVAVNALLRPDTFRALAIRLGYDPQKPIPSTLAIAAFVKPLGGGHACVTEVRGGPCVLDFQEEGGVYKLSGYEGPIDSRKLGFGR